MGQPSFEELAPPVDGARIFTVNKKSRIQDTTIEGKVRLDAIARIVAEVSEEDLLDLDRPNTRWWMARKICIEVVQEASGQQEFVCQTWAGGMARVAAKRRVSLVSEGQAGYETSVTWVSIDSESGRPTLLPAWFAETYATSCNGRKASIALTHQPVEEGAEEVVWPLRQVDFDQHGHVNNRAYWPVIEEVMARYDFDRSKRYRVEIEFRSGVPVAPSVILRVKTHERGIALWWVVDGGVAASATIDYLD